MAYIDQFDHTQLDKDLVKLGESGGSIGYQGYKDLVSYGHSANLLQEAILKAAGRGLKLGEKLNTFLATGIDPDQQAAQDAMMLDQTAAMRAQADATLAAAEANRKQLADQFRISQKAAAERAKMQAEAQRTQMIRERGAGQAANLQIQGQPGFRGRGGSAGFRRRKDQFKIASYKGLGGIEGNTQGAVKNNMVNI